MKIGILEDEIPARDQLIALLAKIDPTIEVVFTGQSVKQGLVYLNKGTDLDLLILDIQLNDGLSLEIFRRIDCHVPVIFATAYDQYMIDAFRITSIDYLLKPIKKSELESALQKYHQLQDHFQRNLQSLLTYLGKERNTHHLTRVLVRRGTKFSSVPVSAVCYFFSEHKLTFLMDPNAEKSLVDQSLSELEEKLDPKGFFRINRQCIAAISGVGQFRSNGKGQLIVELNPKGKEFIVSQEKASSFKNWISGETS